VLLNSSSQRGEAQHVLYPVVRLLQASCGFFCRFFFFFFFL
jgi:hypothetical protein